MRSRRGLLSVAAEITLGGSQRQAGPSPSSATAPGDPVPSGTRHTPGPRCAPEATAAARLAAENVKQWGFGVHWHDPDVKRPASHMQTARQTLWQAGFGWDSSGRPHFPQNETPRVLP